MNKNNAIRYTTSKTKGNLQGTVEITLDDKCNNGHQDFHITGTFWQADKPKVDNYLVTAGSCHEQILKFWPEFEIFVRLHSCDYKGIPTHPISNGFYFLENGFNNTPPTGPKFKKEYCEYYRISSSQFNALSKSKNEVQYGMTLEHLKILNQWEIEAKEAIKVLEKLTDTEFKIDSKRTQFYPLTKSQISKELQKQKDGYYTPKAEAEREALRIEGEFRKLEQEFNKEVAKAKLELQVKKAVLKAGGTEALNNCIFYHHSNELGFNWQSSNKLSPEFIKRIKRKIKLPKKVKIKVEL